MKSSVQHIDYPKNWFLCFSACKKFNVKRGLVPVGKYAGKAEES